MIKPFAGPPCGGFLRRDRVTGTRRSAEGRLYLCKNEWDMETEWDLIVRLCVAGLCGTVIGLDREYRVKDAGFRTHFLVALGSALMMIVSQYGFEGFLATHDGLRLDPSRIAAQVVSGIGFIGAGTIIIHRQLVRGLTTAASLWATAGIGLAAGGHMYVVAGAATVLTLFGLSLPVIQLGGGLLICRTALQWLSDSDSSVGHAQGKDVNPLHKIALESQVFYPITFPISIGPGSVSVILTLMASVSMKDGWAKGLLSYAIIALVVVLMCLILYLFLSQGERIIRKIGTSGSIVINKMVAFFTFCVGVQIVVTGIAKLFHLHI